MKIAGTLSVKGLISMSDRLGYRSQRWVASQLDEFMQFEVEVERSIVRLLIPLGHVVAEIFDELASFFELFQLFLVLLAQVRRAVGVVGCAQTKFVNKEVWIAKANENETT